MTRTLLGCFPEGPIASGRSPSWQAVGPFDLHAFGADHRRMARAPITDDQLHAAIRKRLEWAPEIDPAHITVSVRRGVVTVSGTASSVTEKRAAERTAAGVQGVVAVID